MTRGEARTSLKEWLELAAMNPIFNKYDKLCREAYEVLGSEEYGAIYNQWASGYVYSPAHDGYIRR